MNKENSKDNVLKSISHIEELLEAHDSSQPYDESDIKQIVSELKDMKDDLDELSDKYLKLAEDQDDLEYRVHTVEDKLKDYKDKEEMKHQRELKYIDYAVCSAIGSIVGFYISKLTKGH